MILTNCTRTLTSGGSFEVWPCWLAAWPATRWRYVPDLHYRRDRIGD